jgi:hypothetical protein
MSNERQSMDGLAGALRRARGGILVIAVIYVVSVAGGMVMAHRGLSSAVDYRDAIVARAHRSDPAAKADDAGAHGTAALLDFSRNLGLAAIPETIGGIAIVLPVGMAAYRGWIGGIVSVDGHHRSRLGRPRSAVYYLVTLALQLAGFTLAGGAGLHLGWSLLHHRGPFVGPRWFRLPRPALVDVAWLYVMIVPLFALGSIWEFFAPAR